MLIKIDKARYVNSDHIVMIVPVSTLLTRARSVIESRNGISLADENYLIILTNAQVEITAVIAEYIAQTLDANDAFSDEQPATLSLKSRIAIFLRNQSAGQSLSQIQSAFSQEHKEMIEVALTALQANSVIETLLGPACELLYCHASNPLVANQMNGW